MMRRNEIIKTIFLAAGMGVAIGAVMVVPPLAITFKALMEAIESRGRRIEPWKIKRALYNLEKRKLISLREVNGELLATFNEGGKKLLLKYKFDELEIGKSKEWDGKWRIVVFDIPEKKKLARNVLREKLRRLGFYQLQKSVFVHPFECQREIELVARAYEVEPYLYFVRAEYIDNQAKIQQKFNL